MIYNNVLNYCNRNGIPVCQFERMCELSNGTVSKWKKPDSEPKYSTLLKIEKSTEIPIGEWLK